MDSLIKSPISLVHEIALKRSMTVLFQVVSEKGPPHMRTFVTKCAVGELSATGEGNGKKVRKMTTSNFLTLFWRVFTLITTVPGVGWRWYLVTFSFLFLFMLTHYAIADVRFIVEYESLEHAV